MGAQGNEDYALRMGTEDSDEARAWRKLRAVIREDQDKTLDIARKDEEKAWDRVIQGAYAEVLKKRGAA
jgi:hypothetical protein